MKKWIIIITVPFVFLVGCGPSKFGRQYYQAPEFSFDQVQEKTIGIAILGPGEVKGYEKGFSKVYKDKATFVAELNEALVAAFKAKGRHSMAANLDNGQKEAITNEINAHWMEWNNVSESFTKAVSTLCQKEGVDYLFVVKNWYIEGEWTHTHYPASVGPNGTMTGGNNSYKSCFVKLEGAILSKDGRILFYGGSTAREKVPFFAFQKTLKKAVAIALDRFSLLLSGDMDEKNIWHPN